MAKVFSSLFAGVCGVAVLLAMAAAIVWALEQLRWPPG